MSNPIWGSDFKSQKAQGHVEALRETLRLFDVFRKSAPRKDIVEDLDRRLNIFRSELQTRDAISKMQKETGTL